MAKLKIAVLGGGLGAMSAVYGLTSKPGWEEEYEITVHQLGWRLGGKGASGRGPNGRIQEHGLHILLGFYENAFRMLRDIYSQLEGEPGVFPSFDAAFTGQNLIGLMDRYNGDWSPWLFDFPINPGEAGDGRTKHYDDLWDLIVAAVEQIAHWAESMLGSHKTALHGRHHGISAIWDEARALGHRIEADAEAAAERSLLHALHWLVKHTPKLPEQTAEHQSLVGGLLDHLFDELRHLLQTSSITDVRRAAQVIDMGAAILKGIMTNADAITANGLNALDGEDFQDWLKAYGASELSAEVEHASPVRALYDLSFAFEDGDVAKPNFAAGNALRALFCLGMLYKGSVFHKMNAGMGDTIFTPFYKALKKKGVKFEFFHEVEALTLGNAEGRKVIETIRIGRQATPKAEYNPFVRINDLDCWPQAPLTDQLIEGEALKAGPNGDGTDGWNGDWRGYDLENYWSRWTNVGTHQLCRGEDFDEVILAIPPIAHPLIAGAAVDAIPEWARMVREVKSVRTQAIQLWLNKDLEELGWTAGSTVIDAFVDPLNTWADMSHLLPQETWPASQEPKNIAYLCGPMKGGLPPGRKDPWPAAMAEVAANAEAWLASAPGWLWPTVSQNGKLEVTALDTASGGGKGRLAGQYWRANVFPSEFYVLSAKGSNDARLDANELPVVNLFFAGDWTDNGFNGGCVEAAVISGLRASSAISGYPKLVDIESYW